MMSIMSRILVLFALVLLLALPGTGEARRKNAQLLFDDYNNALRWSDYDRAWMYVDPEIRQSNPLTDLERKRYEMVEMTSVTVRSQTVAADGSVDQVVEIKMIGKYTQRERTITDHQHWRWDAKAKHFWLVSGLPDIMATD